MKDLESLDAAFVIDTFLSKLDASRMLVTEKVFGFLLAALGVQLVLNGLSDVGVIHLTTGH
jgi:small neutral amino acid transporter SnatA (MarC family)